MSDSLVCRGDAAFLQVFEAQKPRYVILRLHVKSSVKEDYPSKHGLWPFKTFAENLYWMELAGADSRHLAG